MFAGVERSSGCMGHSFVVCAVKSSTTDISLSGVCLLCVICIIPALLTDNGLLVCATSGHVRQRLKLKTPGQRAMCVYIYGNRPGECGIAVLVSEVHVRTGWVRSTSGHIGTGAKVRSNFPPASH